MSARAIPMRAKAHVRSALRRLYFAAAARNPVFKRGLDRAIGRLRGRPIVAPPVVELPRDAIRTFEDLQAARIVLNVAELLRNHRIKMARVVDELPPLSMVEGLLASTELSNERVLAELEALVGRYPHFGEAWLELGVAAQDRGDLDAALSHFNKCLALPAGVTIASDRTSCHVQAGIGKARGLERLGREEAAAEAYAAALVGNGSSGIARAEYGRLLRKLGRAPESLVEFEAAMSSDVTAVPLPSLPRDFAALAARLKKRFGSSGVVPPNSNAAAPSTSILASAFPPRSRPKNPMRLRLVTVVWGESFIDIFLRITARSLLSPGNLEALARDYNVSYSIHTTARDAERLRASPVFKKLQSVATIDIVAFDENAIDVKNPSSHWTLWRLAAEQAKRAGETVFFIIPDMIFAVDTLLRWAHRFDEGYRAVCMVSPQVVLESSLAEIEQRFTPGSSEISMSDADVHDLLLRHLHPLMIAMYRDTNRPSRHSDTLLAEAEGAGLVMRVLASQPFCIDLNHFEVNNAFCPVDRLEDIAYEQPYTVCLEPMLKYPDLYFRKEARSQDRLSNMGSWVDYHLGPSDILWANHNARFIAKGRDDERSFRRAERSMDGFVTQMRLTGTIYRVMAAMRAAGCTTAARLLSLTNFAGRLRRHWSFRGEVTVLVPAGDGRFGLSDQKFEELLAPGNEKMLRRAILEHVFPGRLDFAVGDGITRAAAGAPPRFAAGVVRRSSETTGVARVIAGPIDVDDCTIYVVDRAVSSLKPTSTMPATPPHRSSVSILPNRWSVNPGRLVGPPPSDVQSPSPPPAAAVPSVQSQVTVPPASVIEALDTFLKSYFAEASKEDASRAGGLNGHLSVARMLDLGPALSDGTAAVLVSMGALYHRLYYFKEINDRYCDAIGLPRVDMPVAKLIEKLTSNWAPLQRAREYYRAALIIEPDSARAMFNLAGVDALEGAVDEADRRYIEALALDPSLAGHVALRRAALAEARQEWARAADLYVDATRHLQSLGEWHANAASCLRQCGRYDQSLEHYQLALDWVRRPGIEFFVARPSRLQQ